MQFEDGLMMDFMHIIEKDGEKVAVVQVGDYNTQLYNHHLTINDLRTLSMVVSAIIKSMESQ
jgi:hypothetical protein